MRLPFILTTFHSLEAEQISLILERSTTEIETNIQTATKLLGEEHLEKRLKLLEKSYERLPVQFKAKQIMGGAVQSEVNSRTVRQKRGLWIIAGTIIIYDWNPFSIFIPA